MFSGGEGSWADDPRADGWWGDEPPFHMPVFVLTHHARETATMQGGTTFSFVTDGIEAALEQARAAAGDKDVQIHVVPVLLGDGVRLFDHLGTGQVELEATRVIESHAVTHLRYRVVK